LGFVYKHTMGWSKEPDFRKGSCQLLSKLVVGGTSVTYADSYRKAPTEEPA
jgi:hypothetical protein